MGEWEQGLCGCFGNCGVCLYSYFLPCYMHGKTAEAVGEDCLMCGLAMFVPLLNWYGIYVVRSKIREQKGISGDSTNDILNICCCTVCAVAQAGNEMRSATGLGNGMGESMARV